MNLFEYFIFAHLTWGNGLAIKDALISDQIQIDKIVKIYS